MFYEYVLEIKNRFFLISYSWLISVFICYNYKETLLFFLIKLNKNLYYTNSFYFITTSLTDVFNIYIKICCFVSNQFIIVYIIYNCILFIAPGLFNHEYGILKIVSLLSLTLNCWSILVCNLYVLPYIWSFFVNYQNTNSKESINIFFEIQITDYFKFYTEIYHISILVSQFFVLIFFILIFIKNKTNVVKKTRKFMYSFFLIISTILTPPDIISQVILTSIFIFFYEIIVYVVLLKMVLK